MGLPAGDRELVQIVDAALVDAAAKAGAWLVCRPGCTQCCYGAFAISELDALRLADGMAALRGKISVGSMNTAPVSFTPRMFTIAMIARMNRQSAS